jgi:hypothetical protein
MKARGELTRDGAAILKMVQQAGYALVKEGRMPREMLAEISRPLISQEELWRRYN